MRTQVKEMRALVKGMGTKRTTCLEYENTGQGNESSGEGDENKENNLSRI